jgi:hypothetical protein
MNLPRVITDADDIPSGALRRVFATWRALAGERVAPRRSEISPAAFRFALPILWLWDVVDGGQDFSFRLAGERIKAFMRIDHGSKLLSQFPKTNFSDEVRYVFSRCVETSRPLIVGPAPMTYELRRHHIVTVIVLPLCENGAEVTHLLGASEAEAMAEMQPTPAGA